MKKRIFAMLLAVCMIVGLLPMNVLAGTAESRTQYAALTAHDDAQHICEHCVAAGAADTTPEWTAWGEGKTQLPTAVAAYFTSDDETYTVEVVENRLRLVEKEVIPTHIHKLCSDASCADHEDVGFKDWDKTTSLPASGSYCLLADVTLTGVVEVSGELMLCLNGHSVTMTKAGRVFALAGGDILTITDCQTTGKITGGSNKFGGAVNVGRGCTLNLYGGTFTGNSSTSETEGQGGAIYLQAVGSDTTKGGVLNLYGGAISGNEATSGAAIYAKKGAELNIYGGTIADNKANAYGGTIYACEGITTNILGGTFQGNYAKSGGGAVYVTGANSVLNVKDATFADNAIGGYAGGAIFAQSTGTVATVDGCTFTGNSAQAGGAIYASGNTTWTVDNSTFSGNYAEQGACIYEQRATVTVGKVTMENNSVKSRAAGVYCKAGNVTLDGIVIKNNQTSGSGTAICTGSDTVNGETVYPTVNFVSGTISGNEGTSGVILLQSKTVFNMKGGTITGNSCDYAGGVYVSTNATFNMSGGTISNNTAKTSGGTIYALRSTVTLSGGTISGNKTDTGTGDGGGVYSRSASTIVENVKLIGNKSARWGGGITLYRPAMQGVSGQGDYSTGVNFTNIEIRNNTTAEQGGGVWTDSGSKLLLENAVITDNTAGLEGGGIWSQSDLILRNVDVNGNASGGDGYALYLADSLFDGHSYQSGSNKMSGNIKVEGNENGDMYLGPTATVSIEEAGLGQDTKILVTLDSGVLTNRVFGAYNYEGGELNYTVTYGDRSVTDPEYDASLVVKTQETQDTAQGGDVLLYAGIGVIGLAAIAATVLLILKKKKPAKAEN